MACAKFFINIIQIVQYKTHLILLHSHNKIIQEIQKIETILRLKRTQLHRQNRITTLHTCLS